MRRLETQVIERFNETPIDPPASFDVELLDGRKLDYETLISNTPIVTSEYDATASPQMVIGTENGLPYWDKNTYEAGRIDEIHGRTLEVFAGQLAIKDQYDNEYNSLNIKGCDLSNPHFFKTRTAFREYIIHGLQESLVMERIIRASKLLRENEIDTEYICGLVQPVSFPVDQHQSGLDIKEQKPLPEFLEYLSGQFASNSGGDSEKSPLEIKAEMIDRFKDCDYLVTYRAVDCPYRFGELSDAGKFQKAKEFVSKYSEDDQSVEFIEKADQSEFLRFSSFLLGNNVAKMHKIGLKHGFLVPLNITATGSIVDLDSCRGEPLGLGDETITEEDQVQDIRQCLKTIRDTTKSIKNTGNKSFLQFNLEKQSSIYVNSVTLLSSYLKERFESRQDKADFLVALLVQGNDEELREEEGDWLDRLSELVHATYKHLGLEPKNQNFDHLRLLDTKKFRGTSASDHEPNKRLIDCLPAALFREMKDKILAKSWTMNGEYPNEKLAQGKKPIFHPIKSLVRNLALEEMITTVRNDSGDSEYTSDDILFMLGCVMKKIQPRREDKIAATRSIDAYFQELSSDIIDRLAQEHEHIGPELQLLFSHQAMGEDLKDQVGSIRLANAEHRTNILFLRNDQQYADLLEALEMDSNAEVPMFPTVNLSEGTHHLHEGSVLVADYKVAERLAERLSQSEAIKELFSMGSGDKPLLLIEGISKNEPALYLAPRAQSINGRWHVPEIKDYYELQELREIVCPSLATQEGFKLF